jgi:hypothetical protein
VSYKSWFYEHAAKHKELVKKLLQKGYDKDAIIEYFEFENMVENEPQFCPLYEKKQKCHNIDYLNCYLCACPNFRFNDKGIEKIGDKIKYSFCSIDSKNGELSSYGDSIHQNCSGCDIPHLREYISDHFDTDLKKVMPNCEQKN